MQVPAGGNQVSVRNKDVDYVMRSSHLNKMELSLPFRNGLLVLLQALRHYVWQARQ